MRDTSQAPASVSSPVGSQATTSNTRAAGICAFFNYFLVFGEGRALQVAVYYKVGGLTHCVGAPAGGRSCQLQGKSTELQVSPHTTRDYRSSQEDDVRSKSRVRCDFSTTTSQAPSGDIKKNISAPRGKETDCSSFCPLEHGARGTGRI